MQVRGQLTFDERECDTHVDHDTGCTKSFNSLAGDLRIWITHTDDDPGDSRADDRIDTRRSDAMV